MLDRQPLLPSSLTPEAAVLLVLLPVTSTTTVPQPTVDVASLDALQHLLGGAIRVLKIDEASHPAVVRSFEATHLPSCVLVRQGIELWRQQGLPDADVIAPLLLDKLGLPQAVGVG